MTLKQEKTIVFIEGCVDITAIQRQIDRTAPGNTTIIAVPEDTKISAVSGKTIRLNNMRQVFINEVDETEELKATIEKLRHKEQIEGALLRTRLECTAKPWDADEANELRNSYTKEQLYFDFSYNADNIVYFVIYAADGIRSVYTNENWRAEQTNLLKMGYIEAKLVPKEIS